MLILVPLLECDGMAQGTEERCDIVDEEMSNGRALSSYNRAASKRTRRRKSIHPSSNAARERSRVQNLKQAFLELQKALPNVPSGTKLSKLDILLLATNYISHLMSKLSNGHLKEHLSRLKDKGALHPIKKWPMRSRLYVSDPIWLYRSGRQNMMNQRIESPAPSSVSCEESPPRLDPFDLQSSSCSPMEDKERLPFQSIYREDTINDRGVDINISYAYHGAERPYLGSMEEERQNFRTSSCRYQKALPEL